MPEQQPTDRLDPRAMLAKVTLATDLPMPTSINWHGDIWAMTIATIADGASWADHLGGETRPYTRNGHRYLGASIIDWHGWSVQLHATEPTAAVRPDVLDEATAAQLADIAAGAR